MMGVGLNPTTLEIVTGSSLQTPPALHRKTPDGTAWVVPVLGSREVWASFVKRRSGPGTMLGLYKRIHDAADATLPHLPP